MKKSTQVVWGIVLVVAGVIFGLNALHITDIDLFFDGWWTLFILVPCTVGLFTERDKTGNLIGLLIGVGLLLWQREIVSFSLLWKLVLTCAVVIVGLRLLLGALFGKKADPAHAPSVGPAPKNATAVFSGVDLDYNGQPFEGASLTAVFGGIKCDLRGAIIDRDCTVQVTAAFGGIDLLLPPNVNAKLAVTGIFGGAENKTAPHPLPDVPTVYVQGVALFGGVDVK
ncbi:MAG: hypothetical protein IJC84_01130 [Clostridia bacterium]|nr:hypothetical protein [Clostridia bacterium]